MVVNVRTRELTEAQKELMYTEGRRELPYLIGSTLGIFAVYAAMLIKNLITG